MNVFKKSLFCHAHCPLLFLPTEEANVNDDSSEVVPDYSQLRVPSAKTLTTLNDVNTKLYIGTEVNIPTNKINIIKQYFTDISPRLDRYFTFYCSHKQFLISKTGK